MKHWSVDTTELKKDPEAFAAWKLEQAVNYGLRQGRISARELRKYWDRLDLDPPKKRFLALLLEQQA
jgi:hypothetical protein